MAAGRSHSHFPRRAESCLGASTSEPKVLRTGGRPQTKSRRPKTRFWLWHANSPRSANNSLRMAIVARLGEGDHDDRLRYCRLRTQARLLCRSGGRGGVCRPADSDTLFLSAKQDPCRDKAHDQQNRHFRSSVLAQGRRSNIGCWRLSRRNGRRPRRAIVVPCLSARGHHDLRASSKAAFLVRLAPIITRDDV